VALRSISRKGDRKRATGVGLNGVERNTGNSTEIGVPQDVIRISPGSKGVSIWSSALFGDLAGTYLREFLARVFSVQEVSAVEIQRSKSFGRVYYDSTPNPAEIWLKLRRALGSSSPSNPDSESAVIEPDPWQRPQGVESLYLDGPGDLPIWVNRVDESLSTWRLRYLKGNRIRLTHPILLKRKDVAYRLEEELSAILGVEDFRTNTVSASVAIRFNLDQISASRLVRQLEKSWPSLLDGLEGPPSSRRLVIASGLLGLSYTGQYVVPALKPWALLAVALYGLPNVKSGARQLVHRKIGLPVLYTSGLVLTLLAGMPFSSGVMAVMMQLWPRLTYGTMTRSQRRLFAVHRRRATWARAVHNGIEMEVDLDTLSAGDLIAVREGEIIPVDGVVTNGLAAVDEETLSGSVGAIDKAAGDKVLATSFIRDGRLTVRVEKIGVETVAGSIGARLPHSRIDGLLSSAEAESVASRNAKPTLAVAGISLLATRLLRPAQAIIRPDYATGPRLGAQLNALFDVGDGLQRGILFRDPTASDRLPATDVYIFDEAIALDRRRIEVAEIFAADDASADDVLAYATAAFPASQNERVSILLPEIIKRNLPIPEIFGRSRHAGAIRYHDIDDHLLEIAAPAYVAAEVIKIPSGIADAVAASPYAWNPQRTTGKSESPWHTDPLLRPLWVLRNSEVLGVITFRREGEPEGIEVVAELKSRNPRASFAYISSAGDATARAVAERFGISTVFSKLDPEGKSRAVKDLGRRTMWIGDGAAPESIPGIHASTVSISIAGISTASRDAADIVLLQPGLRNLVPLRRIGRAHRARLEGDYRGVYAANLFGAAGGLLAGFGSLEAGLSSNVGSGYVYFRNWKKLRDLTSRAEARRAIVMSATIEEGDHLAPTLKTHSDAAEQFVDYLDIDPSKQPGSGHLHGV
jgi:cation-transporting P-type ATPase C